MVTLTESRTVPTPIDEAFAYTADFTNIEHWDPGVASSTRIDTGPIGVGSSFLLEVRMGAGTSEMRYVITEFEAPSRVVLTGTGPKVDAVDVITFAPADGGTRIDYRADLQFKGMLRFAVPLIGSRLDKIGRDAVDGLQRVLTEGATD